MVGRLIVSVLVFICFLGLYLSGLKVLRFDIIHLSKLSISLIFLVNWKKQLRVTKYFAATIALYFIFFLYYLIRIYNNEFDFAANDMLLNFLLALFSMSIIYQSGINKRSYSKIQFICLIFLATAILFYNSGFEVTKTGRLLFLTRNPNEVSFWLILGLASSSLDRTIYVSPIYVIVVFLCIIALIKLNSRGGILLVLILLIDVLVQNKKYIVYLTILSLVFTKQIIRMFQSNIYIEMLLERMEMTQEGDTGGRMKIWKYLWDVITDNFLFGIGRTQSYEILLLKIGKAVDAHNLFISVLVEYGLVGMMILMAWYVIFVHKYVTFSRRTILLSFLVLVHAMKAGGVMYSYLFAIFLLTLLINARKKNPLFESSGLQ